MTDINEMSNTEIEEFLKRRMSFKTLKELKN